MGNIRILIILLFALAAAKGTAAHAQYDTDFNGSWRGVIQIIDPQIQSAAFPDLSEAPVAMDMSIDISDQQVSVFILLNDEWHEVKPGRFGIVSHKTNAIIVAIDSYISSTSKSGWVETWNITLTAKDENAFYAYWVRAVSNPSLKVGQHPDARFFLSGFGELKRADAVPNRSLIRALGAAQKPGCHASDSACGNASDSKADALNALEKVEQRR